MPVYMISDVFVTLLWQKYAVPEQDLFKNCIPLSQQRYKKHLKSYTPAPAPVQELHISVTGLLKTSEIICTCIKTTRPDRIVNATNQGWGGVQDNREVSATS